MMWARQATQLVIWSAFFLCSLSKTVLATSGILTATSERSESFGARIDHLRARGKAGKTRTSKKKGKRGRGKKAAAPPSATPTTTSPSFLRTSSPSQAQSSKKSKKGSGKGKGKKATAPPSPSPSSAVPSFRPTPSPVLILNSQNPSATTRSVAPSPAPIVTTLLDDELSYTVGVANETYNETEIKDDIRNATSQILAKIPPNVLRTRRHLLGLHDTNLTLEHLDCPSNSNIVGSNDVCRNVTQTISLLGAHSYEVARNAVEVLNMTIQNGTFQDILVGLGSNLFVLTQTPAPATTAPATAAPVTAAPVTTAPATTAPVTTAPVTTAPATTAPVTTVPATTAPATTAPTAPVSEAKGSGWTREHIITAATVGGGVALIATFSALGSVVLACIAIKLIKHTVVAIYFDDSFKDELKKEESERHTWMEYVKMHCEKAEEDLGDVEASMEDVKQVAIRIDTSCSDESFQAFLGYAKDKWGVEEERVSMAWEGSLKVIIDCEKRNVLGLGRMVCEEAEEYFNTLMSANGYMPFKIDGKEVMVKANNVSPVIVTRDSNKENQGGADNPDRLSLREIILKTSRLEGNDGNEDLAFYQAKDLDLFVPKTIGGGKRLQCIPYYQQAPVVSKLFRWGKKRKEKVKPAILKANENVFFVLKTNTELFDNSEFEEYNEDNKKSRETDDYLIFKRKQPREVKEGVSSAGNEEAKEEER